MREYFCGWYFKCQSDEETVAIIPAIHRHGRERSCSIQIITEENAWNFVFPYEQFHRRRGFQCAIGSNRFSRDGLELCLHGEGISVAGSIEFGPFSSIQYDIMGPFRYVPFMECRHSVVSIRHEVTGTLLINDLVYHFQRDFGYIEGDRGYSFPRLYAWTQCGFDRGSLMLSVAEIPMGRFCFTGVICVICYEEQEYRIATYLGAQVLKNEKGEIIVRQGDILFSVKLLEKHAHPLRAPVCGAMDRTIYESATCRAAYRLERDGNTLFCFESPKASFEYEYPS